MAPRRAVNLSNLPRSSASDAASAVPDTCTANEAHHANIDKFEVLLQHNTSHSARIKGVLYFERLLRNAAHTEEWEGVTERAHAQLEQVLASLSDFDNQRLHYHALLALEIMARHENFRPERLEDARAIPRLAALLRSQSPLIQQATLSCLLHLVEVDNDIRLAILQSSIVHDLAAMVAPRRGSPRPEPIAALVELAAQLLHVVCSEHTLTPECLIQAAPAIHALLMRSSDADVLARVTDALVAISHCTTYCDLCARDEDLTSRLVELLHCGSERVVCNVMLTINNTLQRRQDLVSQFVRPELLTRMCSLLDPTVTDLHITQVSMNVAICMSDSLHPEDAQALASCGAIAAVIAVFAQGPVQWRVDVLQVIANCAERGGDEAIEALIQEGVVPVLTHHVHARHVHAVEPTLRGLARRALEAIKASPAFEQEHLVLHDSDSSPPEWDSYMTAQATLTSRSFDCRSATLPSRSHVPAGVLEDRLLGSGLDRDDDGMCTPSTAGMGDSPLEQLSLALEHNLREARSARAGAARGPGATGSFAECGSAADSGGGHRGEGALTESIADREELLDTDFYNDDDDDGGNGVERYASETLTNDTCYAESYCEFQLPDSTAGSDSSPTALATDFKLDSDDECATSSARQSLEQKHDTAIVSEDESERPSGTSDSAAGATDPCSKLPVRCTVGTDTHARVNGACCDSRLKRDGVHGIQNNVRCLHLSESISMGTDGPKSVATHDDVA